MDRSPASRTGFELAFHFVVSAVLLVFVSIRLGGPVWTFAKPVANLAYATVGIYLAAAVALALYGRRSDASRDLMWAIAFATGALVLVISAVAGSGLPRTVTVWAPLLGLGLLLLGQWKHPRKSWIPVALLLVLAPVGLLLVKMIPEWNKSLRLSRERPVTSVSYQRTALYDLVVTTHRHYVPRTPQSNGGIALFGDRYLLSNGRGDLYAFSSSADARSLEIQELVYKVPINIQEFNDDAGTTVHVNLFRVADVIAREEGGIHRVFASHHFWKADERCWLMRVSMLEGPLDEFLSATPTLAWKTVFDSKPCVPLANAGEPPQFVGMENGGRMAWLGKNKLLVTIGDHAINGWSTPARAAQDESYSHGKIIAVDTDSLSSEIFSLGHRNAQGLLVTASGQVWATEHGPEGGDELNLIQQGGNYGWPLVSYGTEYGSHVWPLAELPGSHDGFVQPFYSWVPSIGVSSLLEVDSSRFEFWRGDLIVTSLRAESYWRLRVRDGRIVMSEHIPFGERMREVIQGHDGELVVWSDERNIHFIRPAEAGDVVSGESIYRTCAACHVATAGMPAAIAPGLVGIVGRTVAADREFQYSPVLREMGGTWTKERLDAFLADPRAFAPGTSMMFAGIPDASSRRALIEYLAAPESKLDEAPPEPVF